MNSRRKYGSPRSGTPTALRGRGMGVWTVFTPTQSRERGTHGFSRGFTVLEVALALTVLLAAAVLLTQFLVASSQQRRGAEQRRVALEEISNRMERALAARYDDVTTETLGKEPL